MYSVRSALLPLLFVLSVTVLLGSAAPAPLSARIDDLLQRWDVEEAFWGVAVYDTKEGYIDWGDDITYETPIGAR